MYITRWAPVTSMFETIVWVTMCTSLLMLWVTFLPLLGPTSKAAWGLTAFLGGGERGAGSREEGAGSGDAGSRSPASARLPCAMRLALFVAGLFIGLSYMGVLQPWSGGSGYHPEAILPRADLGSSMPNLSTSLGLGGLDVRGRDVRLVSAADHTLGPFGNPHVFGLGRPRGGRRADGKDLSLADCGLGRRGGELLRGLGGLPMLRFPKTSKPSCPCSAATSGWASMC